jgi:hypothetical protein
MVIDRRTIMVTAPVEPTRPTTRHYLGRPVTGVVAPGLAPAGRSESEGATAMSRMLLCLHPRRAGRMSADPRLRAGSRWPLAGLCQVGARGRLVRRSHHGAGRLHTGQAPAQQASRTRHLVEQLPQGQADAAGFGRRSRSRVRKPYATQTKVTWWCRPTRPGTGRPNRGRRRRTPGGAACERNAP